MALTQPWGALAALAALVVVAALALLTRGAVPPGAGAPIAGAERLRALPRFRALAARRSRTRSAMAYVRAGRPSPVFVDTANTGQPRAARSGATRSASSRASGMSILLSTTSRGRSSSPP